MSSGPNPSYHGNQTVNYALQVRKIPRTRSSCFCRTCSVPLATQKLVNVNGAKQRPFSACACFTCWFKFFKDTALKTSWLGLVIAFVFVSPPDDLVFQCARINYHMLNLLWTILRFNLSTGKGKNGLQKLEEIKSC